MKQSIKRFSLMITAFVAFVIAFLVSSPVYADTAEITRKVTIEGLRSCFLQDGIVTNLKFNEYKVWNEDILNSTTVVSTKGEGMKLPLPNGYYKYDNASCTEFLIGDGKSNGFGGAQHVLGLETPVNKLMNSNVGEMRTKVSQYMKKLGFEEEAGREEEVSTTWCFSLPYYETMTIPYYPSGQLNMGDRYTNYGCLEVDKNNKVIDVSVEPYWDTTKKLGQAYFYLDGDMVLRYKTEYCVAGGGLCWTDSVGLDFSGGGLCMDGYECSVDGISNWYYAKAQNMSVAYAAALGTFYWPGPPEKKEPVVNKKQIVGSYKRVSGRPAWPSYGIQNGPFENYPNYNTMAFTKGEKFELYSYYISTFYNSGSTDIICTTNETNKAYYRGNDYAEFKMTDNEGEKSCFAHKPTRNKKKKVNGLNASLHFDGTQVSFDDIIASLDGLSVEIDLPDRIPPDDPSNPSNPGGTNGGGGNVTNDPEREGCFKEAGAMGWIICPLIFGLRDAANGIYEKYIEPLLAVSSSTVAQLRSSGSGNKGLFGTWEVFRNVANIVFVIMLLVIILSQLTGVGIDNYGIKRTLPRLIVAVIMVNVSFIICAICVDISNILGIGLKKLFESMALGIPINLNTEVLDAAGMVTGIITTLVSVLSVGVGVVGIISTFQAGAGWTIIMPVLMFLLGAFISIVFIFITLGTRQALIIVMIAMSPLAFVCYLLPNTNSLFKKWITIFEGLLLVYPLASLLVGGGYLASRVILSGNESDFFITIVAGLAAVVPYFFIPSLVRGSMKGIGNLGGVIQGLGRGVRGGVDRGIRNTQGFRNAEQRRTNAMALGNARRQTRRYAQRADGFAGRLGMRKKDASGNYVIDQDRVNRASKNPRNAVRLQQFTAASSTVAGLNPAVVGAQASYAARNLGQNAIDARAAGIREAEEDKAITDQEALIKASDNFKQNKWDALATEYEQAAINGDTDRARAYQNLMMGTDAGRAAMLNSFANIAQNSGVSQEMKDALHGDLRGKHSDKLKSGGNRSAYDELKKDFGKIDPTRLQVQRQSGAPDISTATGNNTSSSGRIDYGNSLLDYSAGTTVVNYDGVNADNYSQETLAGSDDMELDKLLKLSADADLVEFQRARQQFSLADYDAYKNGTFSGPLTAQQQEAAKYYDTLSTERRTKLADTFDTKLTAAQQANLTTLAADRSKSDALIAKRNQLATMSRRTLDSIGKGQLSGSKGETIKRLEMLGHTAESPTTTIHLHDDGSGGFQGDLNIT